MSDAGWAAVTAIVMACINTAGSVLLLWIRAKYRWHNGERRRPPADDQDHDR